jgi:predicted alpha/beta-hydrolase family hydrolase
LESPFMAAIATGLAERGWLAVRFGQQVLARG